MCLERACAALRYSAAAGYEHDTVRLLATSTRSLQGAGTGTGLMPVGSDPDVDLRCYVRGGVRELAVAAVAARLLVYRGRGAGINESALCVYCLGLYLSHYPLCLSGGYGGLRAQRHVDTAKTTDPV